MLLQKRLEAFSVLRHINSVIGSTEYINTLLIQKLGELNRGLSAESHNNAVGFLGRDNTHNVLVSQRFKVKSVGCIEVGRNGFGVIINDNNLVARLFKRPYAMYGSVVELNTLADSNRARTEYDNRLFITILFLNKLLRLVFLIECGIEIRSLGVKLGGAGINHFINGKHGLADFLAR